LAHALAALRQGRPHDLRAARTQARTYRILKEFFMKLTSNCEATTTFGKPCKMRAVIVGGEISKYCRCHHPQIAPLTHAHNRERIRSYWQRRKLAEALAATGMPRE
jgi:hypothetical protein